MRSENFQPSLIRILAVLSLIVLSIRGAEARSFKVLYSFKGSGDGAGPHAGLVRDAQGNLYGTTGGGGAYSGGTVFRLTHQPDGTWKEDILHSFNPDSEGIYPDAGLLLDGAGNLYGTTSTGGAHLAGSVFEVSPGPSGWTTTTLYDFCSQPNCEDGGGSWAGLVRDQAGSLYGTARGGGVHSGGVAFELTPSPAGWGETVLHSFDIDELSRDGVQPLAALRWGPSGSLFGTTSLGGNYPPQCPVSGGCGMVFKLIPNGDGTWRERVLHRFAAFTNDGQHPSGSVVADQPGRLYGTTAQGGSQRCGEAACGTVFNLTRQQNGRWKTVVLHNFKPGRSGSFPVGGVVFDEAGNIYGVTSGGGDDQCSCGVIYKLVRSPDGTWAYTVLHRFRGADGAFPTGSLVVDGKARLLGTTQLGGTAGVGVAFRLAP